MRLSDLISCIRLASRQFAEAPLDNKLRLSLIKRAFPRPDLLAWVDQAATKPVAPRFYFPFLLIAVAAQIALREDRDCQVACASPEHLEMLGGFPRPASGTSVELPTTAAPELIAGAALPPLDRIGLIAGVFTRAELVQELLALQSLHVPQATRVLIMNGACYRAWRAAETAASGSGGLFHGVLQYWGDRNTYLLYSPGEEIGAEKNARFTVV